MTGFVVKTSQVLGVDTSIQPRVVILGQQPSRDDLAAVLLAMRMDKQEEGDYEKYKSAEDRPGINLLNGFGD
jgi:hypothetical protein